MHKHIVVAIRTFEAATAFEIADRITGFVRVNNEVTFTKGHFLIPGIQTGRFTPIFPVVAIADDPSYPGCDETRSEFTDCRYDCANVN